MNTQPAAKPFADHEHIESTFYFKRLLNEKQKEEVRAAPDEDKKKELVAKFVQELAAQQ